MAALLALLLVVPAAHAEPIYPHRSGVLIAWSPEQWDSAWNVTDGNGYKNLDRLKADGFTHVDFQIYNSQDATQEQDSTLVNVLDNPTKRALYVRAIDYAHSIGLKVVLKPHVGGAPQTTSYFPPDPVKFFAAYKSMLDSVAVLGNETDTEMIVVGTELGAKLSSNYWKDRGYTSFDVTAWWRNTMIPSVRAKAPSALLTYAATSTPHLHQNINANEAPYVTFWDLLDRIGLNGYFNMNDIATRLGKAATDITEADFYSAMHDNGLAWTGENSYIDPVFSIANLKAKSSSDAPNPDRQNQMRYFRHIAEGIYKLYGPAGTRRQSATLGQQAIFTEWGVPGADSSLDFWAENQKTTSAWERQRRGYAAAMREFSHHMADGAGSWFAGTAIWQILPWHNPTSTTSPSNWLMEFDPIGKPAEAVIKEAYTTGLTGGDTTAPAAPSASPAPGTYTADQSVSLAAEAGATIRYTINGTAPTATTGTVYSAPIPVSAASGTSTTMTIRAVAVDAAGNVSPVATLGYTIDKSSSGTRTVTLTPEADTHVRQAAPTTAHGSATRLRVDRDDAGTAGSEARAYLRFAVPALAAGESVQSARLSLYVADATDDGPAVWKTGTSWSESSMTWNSGRPSRSGTTAVGNFAGMALGRQSVAVSGVTGSGLVSFELAPDGTNLLTIVSREDSTTTNRPQLVLTIATSGDSSTQPPPAPTNLSASAGDARVALSWTGSSGATGYNVYRASGGGSLTRVSSASPTTTSTSFTDTGLTNGTQYSYAVRAVNSAGESGNSNTVTATPVASTSSGTRTVTLTAEADTHVRQAAPTTAHGSQSRMRVDLNDTGATGSEARAYLRFNVPALAAGESVQSARLSLQVTDETSNGPVVWKTGTSWAESTMTWNSGRPARSGTTAVGNFGSLPVGRQSVALSGVSAGGLVSFELMPESSNLLLLASREDTSTSNRPQLVLTIAGG